MGLDFANCRVCGRLIADLTWEVKDWDGLCSSCVRGGQVLDARLEVLGRFYFRFLLPAAFICIIWWYILTCFFSLSYKKYKEKKLSFSRPKQKKIK